MSEIDARAASDQVQLATLRRTESVAVLADLKTWLWEQATLKTLSIGKAAAYVTRNGGRTWRRLDRGLPQQQAWWTVKRQAMAGDARDPVGLYLGTTQGELWASRDEGERWSCIARGLPEIYALETAEPAR